MKNLIPASCFLFILMLFSACAGDPDIYYNIPENPWPEKYGNHRAIITVNEPAEAVELNFMWRRHDANPEDKRFFIIHSESGDTISNIERIEINQERCHILFY